MKDILQRPLGKGENNTKYKKKRNTWQNRGYKDKNGIIQK